MWLRWVSLAVFTLLLVSKGYGGEPVEPIQTIPEGEDNIQAISKGQPAPFSGQLYSPETALRWGNWLTQYRYRLNLDVGRERALCAIELEHRDSLLSIERGRAFKVEASLTESLKRSEEQRAVLAEEVLNPSWYRTVELGVVVGVLATVGVLSLSIWALEARGE